MTNLDKNVQLYCILVYLYYRNNTIKIGPSKI